MDSGFSYLGFRLCYFLFGRSQTPLVRILLGHDWQIAAQAELRGFVRASQASERSRFRRGALRVPFQIHLGIASRVCGRQGSGCPAYTIPVAIYRPSGCSRRHHSFPDLTTVPGSFDSRSRHMSRTDSVRRQRLTSSMVEAYASMKISAPCKHRSKIPAI